MWFSASNSITKSIAQWKQWEQTIYMQIVYEYRSRVEMNLINNKIYNLKFSIKSGQHKCNHACLHLFKFAGIFELFLLLKFPTQYSLFLVNLLFYSNNFS